MPFKASLRLAPDVRSACNVTIGRSPERATHGHGARWLGPALMGSAGPNEGGVASIRLDRGCLLVYSIDVVR
jgi:hypothetical protein